MTQYQDLMDALRGRRCTRKQREEAARAITTLGDELHAADKERTANRETISKLQSEVARLAHRADESNTRIADAIRILSAPPSLAAPPDMPGQPARLNALGFRG